MWSVAAIWLLALRTLHARNKSTSASMATELINRMGLLGNKITVANQTTLNHVAGSITEFSITNLHQRGGTSPALLVFARIGDAPRWFRMDCWNIARSLWPNVRRRQLLGDIAGFFRPAQQLQPKSHRRASRARLGQNRSQSSAIRANPTFEAGAPAAKSS